MTAGGYLRRFDRSHLLAVQGYLYVHREVLFEKIGFGPHRCHRCGVHVNWMQPRPDRLEVDHLDFDRSNNAPQNLEPCCRTCNTRHRRPWKWSRTLGREAAA